MDFALLKKNKMTKKKREKYRKLQKRKRMDIQCFTLQFAAVVWNFVQTKSLSESANEF